MNQRPGDSNVRPLHPTLHSPFRGTQQQSAEGVLDPAEVAQELLASFAVPEYPDSGLTHVYETYRAAAIRIAQALQDASPLALCDTLVTLRWSRAQAVAGYLDS